MNLLTIEDLMQELQCGKRTVENLYKSGRIPYVRIGRTIRFIRGDVDAYLLSSRVLDEKIRKPKRKFVERI